MPQTLQMPQVPQVPPMRAAHRPRGFTLIEMVVVMVLGVLLVGMAVPAMQAMVARVRLEGVVNELGVDLQYARAEAVRRRDAVAVQVDAQGSGYTVGTAALTLKTVALPSDVSLSPGSLVVFDGLRGTTGADSVLDSQSTRHPVKLRIGVTSIGRLRLCTPDDSFGGYPSC